ncbi:hypothetical protein TcCL_NonESM12591 [Trypanosoma cruzi]|nr:hypothetical protein TcCL_NonESM12591 [Trypanosoma cruzi]
MGLSELFVRDDVDGFCEGSAPTTEYSSDDNGCLRVGAAAHDAVFHEDECKENGVGCVHSSQERWAFDTAASAAAIVFVLLASRVCVWDPRGESSGRAFCFVFLKINLMARVAVTRAPSRHGVTAVSLQDAAGPGAGCCRQPCANNNGPASETLLAPGSPDNTGQLTLAPRRRQRAPPPGEQQRRHPTPMEGKEIQVVCSPHVIFKSFNLRGALCLCVCVFFFLFSFLFSFHGVNLCPCVFG